MNPSAKRKAEQCKRPARIRKVAMWKSEEKAESRMQKAECRKERGKWN
jgi:hypothetical protein